MYKCEYCDSVFTEYHNVCPNCGGNSWLTESKKKVKKEHPVIEGFVSIVMFIILALPSIWVIVFADNGAIDILRRLYNLVFSLFGFIHIPPF